MSAAKERDLSDGVMEIEHVEIPLRDGTVLAARLWLPKDALQTPVPAILEYLPYQTRRHPGSRGAHLPLLRCSGVCRSARRPPWQRRVPWADGR